MSAFRNLLAKLGLSRSEREQTPPPEAPSAPQPHIQSPEDDRIRKERQREVIEKADEERERRQSEPPNKSYD